MLNPRLSARYAKSLIDVAIERDQPEVIYQDIKYIEVVCKSSPEFVNVLKSPVISHEKKAAILVALAKDKISDLTTSFLRFLVTKKREIYLPAVVNAVICQYYQIKEKHKVKLTTAIPINDDVRTIILDKIKRETFLENIDLECAVNEKLIGGFILEFNNNRVDASISKCLRELKESFLKGYNT